MQAIVSIQLTVKVLDLEKRLEAAEALVQAQARQLEALERAVTASPKAYAVLYAQAKAMKAQDDALKREIAAILEAHPGQKAYTIRSYLTRNPPPSLRRVQEIIRETPGGIGSLVATRLCDACSTPRRLDGSPRARNV